MGKFKSKSDSPLTEFIKNKKTSYVPYEMRRFYEEYRGNESEEESKLLSTKGLINDLADLTNSDAEKILDSLSGICWDEKTKEKLKKIR